MAHKTTRRMVICSAAALPLAPASAFASTPPARFQDGRSATAGGQDAELVALAVEWLRLEGEARAEITRGGRAWEAAGRPAEGEDTRTSRHLLGRQAAAFDELRARQAVGPEGMRAKAAVLAAWTSGLDGQPAKRGDALAWSLALDVLVLVQS